MSERFMGDVLVIDLDVTSDDLLQTRAKSTRVVASTSTMRTLKRSTRPLVCRGRDQMMLDGVLA